MADGIVMDIIGTATVSAVTTCVADASAFVGFSLKGRHLTFDNCDIDISTVNDYPPSCDSGNISNATAELPSKVAELLDAAIVAKDNEDARTAKQSMILKVQDAITATAVSTCTSAAANNVFFSLTAGGDVNINGCDIQSQASAIITSCMHQVDVSTPNGLIPLGVYVKNEITNSGNYVSVTDPATGRTLPALPPDCPDPTAARTTAYVGMALIAVALLSYVLIVINWVLLRRQRQR